jgi:hypothetical protein
MTLLDFDDAVDRSRTPPGWEKLMAHLDLGRIEMRRAEPRQAEIDRRVHQVQQMLIAATMASGAILAVAAVMLIRLL